MFNLEQLNTPGRPPKPQPVPGADPPPAKQRKLDDWLKSFAQFAKYGEAPDNTLFWTGVSTIAGALRRQVWIDMGYFKWVPNFYVILVAKPGIISKSTTANIGMNLLRKVPGLKWGPEVVTWPALVQGMAEAQETFLDPSTGEYIVQSALTICSDEFGNLLNPQDREMVDIFVSLWDGKEGTFEKKTKSSGNDAVINPYINILACTTPAWISGNFPEYMIGGGFTSRCIFVFAENKRQLVAYPKRLMDKHGGSQDLALDLINDLEVISKLAGEMTLTEEAFLWGEEWYSKHYAAKHRHLDQDQFGGYLARKQTHIHKLAMILSASRGDSLVITPDMLEESSAIVTGLETDMNRVFAKIGQNEVTRLSAQLVERITVDGPMEQWALYNLFFRVASYNIFTEALNSCVNAGHLALMNNSGKILVSRVNRPAP